MASRDVADLDPRFRPKAIDFLAACDREGLNVLVVCTARDRKEQEAEYARGRTVPGRIVTYAKPGESAHNWGFALDGCPRLNGRLVWNMEDGDQVSDEIWQVYGRIARGCGLEWGGDWGAEIREGPHVQDPKWRQLSGARRT